jgi:hypothetical protein
VCTIYDGGSAYDEYTDVLDGGSAADEYFFLDGGNANTNVCNA